MMDEVARVKIDRLENDGLEIDGPENVALEKGLQIGGLENDGRSIQPIQVAAYSVWNWYEKKAVTA